MRKLLLAVPALLIGCATNMWIPLQTSPRGPVSYQNVQFLQAPPDHPFTEIGIITPPEDEYETEAEMVMAIRKEAGKHGADAIFIESQDEKQGWSFGAGPFGASGGSGTFVKVRAKAIVWNSQPAT
ncbi:MAG TPA: hypothetical protein VF883_03750 [Thermoanaerobaculia bacterium]|jgi:hypothetical protein